jgi:hypothetical protein
MAGSAGARDNDSTEETSQVILTLGEFPTEFLNQVMNELALEVLDRTVGTVVDTEQLGNVVQLGEQKIPHTKGKGERTTN